jgi:uncharacterized protein YrrD
MGRPGAIDPIFSKETYMKRLVIAISMLFLAGSVLAQQAAVQQQTEGQLFIEGMQQGDLRASELMGATVYVSEAEIVATEVDGTPEGWESVGRVDDIIFSRDGNIRGIMLDVGGFLGLGARSVVVGMDALRLVGDANSDNVYVVFMASREQLEAAPEYRHEIGVQADAPPVQTQPAPPAEPAPPAQTQPAPPAEPAPPAQTQPVAPAQPGVAEDRLGVREPAEGFQRAEWTVLTADDLQRAQVYDRFNERVSGISDVVLSADGNQVEGVLINIGGFLGLGARTVFVDGDFLEVHHDPDFRDVRVYLHMTEAELDALPEYRRP